MMGTMMERSTRSGEAPGGETLDSDHKRQSY